MAGYAKLRKIASSYKSNDPPAVVRDCILRELGDISGLELFGDQVMVATYTRPEMTAGGIILTDSALQQDRFQSKVGLVLKLGPLAFKDDAVNGVFFGGANVAVNDWVFFRPADGMEFFSEDRTGGVPCRVFRDRDIKGRLSDPSAVW